MLLVTLPSISETFESKELRALESALDATLSLVAFKSLRKDVIELPWLVIVPSAVDTRLVKAFRVVASAFW